MAVLITRPLPDAQETAAKLNEIGIETFLLPLFYVERISLAIEEARHACALKPQGIMVTSVNAVRIIVEKIQPKASIPIYCSGDKAAAFLKQHGYRNIHCAHKDSMALVELIEEFCRPEDGDLVYLSAKEVSNDIGGILEDKGYAVSQIAVYQNISAQIPKEDVDLLGRERIDTVLFFSPSAAKAFYRLAVEFHLHPWLKSMKALCISKVVASCLEKLPFDKIQTPPRPTEDSLLALLSNSD